MSIKELKSLILSDHGSKPFFLDYFIDNSKLVKDLLNMNQKDKKEENIINVYFDIQNLRINVRDKNA